MKNRYRVIYFDHLATGEGKYFKYYKYKKKKRNCIKNAHRYVNGLYELLKNENKADVFCQYVLPVPLKNLLRSYRPTKKYLLERDQSYNIRRNADARGYDHSIDALQHARVVWGQIHDTGKSSRRDRAAYDCRRHQIEFHQRFVRSGQR